MLALWDWPVTVSAEARPIGEVRRLYDQRVAFEASPGVAHPHPHAGADVRLPIERNDSCLVNHLVANDDDARRLRDVRAVAVNHRHDRTDDAAREATIVVRKIGVRVAHRARALRAPLVRALPPGRRQLG
jgi:hypothetical protein